MTPKEIAQRAIQAAERKSRFPEMFKDEIAKEISRAIEQEREQISHYLTHLNESIAHQPHLVRHKLIMGSSQVATGMFLDELSITAKPSWSARLSPARSKFSPK